MAVGIRLVLCSLTQAHQLEWEVGLEHGLREEPGRRRGLEQGILGFHSADLAFGGSSTCGSSPNTASLPTLGRKGMSPLVPKDLSDGEKREISCYYRLLDQPTDGLSLHVPILWDLP